MPRPEHRTTTLTRPVSRGARRATTAGRLALPLALALLLPLPPAVAQVSSTFDAGLDGWQVTGDNASTWQPTGGNPGGCLAVNDLAEGDYNYAVAPPRYLGDWSAATAADSLAVDYRLETLSGSPLSRSVFVISGPGGRAASAAVHPPELVWTTYQVALDPALWTVEAGDWASILANVTSLRVNGEFVYGEEGLWADNVTLSLTPSPVFLPCVLADFNDGGTGDWSFVGGTSSNPGSGGNGGGYLRVEDTAGAVSYAFAPASFGGDWSALDGSGRVTVDLRLLGASGAVVGAAELIRLSGPGGVAHVALAAGEVPANPLEWRRVEVPVDAAAWTLDQGSWAGLLSSVQEVRLQVEVADGTQVVGLDNFGRLSPGCETVDDDVVVRVPGLTLTDRLSFPEIHNVAFNPADGELYGVLRSSSAGDGVYAVTGPQARTRLQSYDRPAHLVFDQDGDAFVSEDYDGVVYRLASGGGSSLWVSGLHSGDDDPYGFAVAPGGFDGPSVSPGDILVTDYGNGGADEIWAFSPDTAEGEAYLASTTGGTVYDLAAGSSGVVYGADNLDGTRLLRVAPDGVVSDLDLAQTIGAPLSVVRDPGGDDLYVASDTGSGFAVYRVEPADGSVTLVADGFAGLTPCCLELASDRLWVADAGWGRVYELTLALFLDGFETGDTSGWSSVAP